MEKQYDYLVVGAGLYGSVIAHELKRLGKKVLVIDKRDHIGGNCFSKEVSGVQICVYGGHIFHTSNKKIWDYVNRLIPFSNYTHYVLANYKGQLFNLPFNMNTFYQMWKAKNPREAEEIINSQRFIGEPKNLTEQAESLVGKDIFEKLIKGYTEKQWNKKCEELPPFIIKRLPIKFTFDNNYFNDLYQGMPEGGYTPLFEKLLEGVEVKLKTDFFSDKEHFLKLARKVVYSGRIDEFFGFKFGKLEYRSLRHEIKELPVSNYLGCATMNFTDFETPYTRIIEFKHFYPHQITPNTVIVTEYPEDFDEKNIPYYPINDEKNNELYLKYLEEAKRIKNVFFGGRLGSYKYLDMDKTIEEAFKKLEEIKQEDSF